MIFNSRINAFKSVAISVITSLALTIVRANPAIAQESDMRRGLEVSTTPENQNDLFGDAGIFQKITSLLLFLVGAISVIMLIIGGIRYVVSAGDQQAVTNAKNTILYAIVGIVVAFVAYGAVDFILTQLETA